MATDKPTIFFLLGPTASGKTKLAVKLVKRFPFEIISVDSAQIYYDMNIGVAKPSQDILEIAPHHLINIIKPFETYSVAKFTKDTLKLINEILLRKHIPLLVGGTMMYFNRLEKGINQMPATDHEIRKNIELEATQIGWLKLYERLKVVDPEIAQKINPNDTQRISRALEVFYSSGKSLSSFHKSNIKSDFPFVINKIGLIPSNRKELHVRIESRVYEMIDAGLIDEVISLRQRYPELKRTMPSMRSVGYRQIFDFLDGRIEKKECIDQIIFATRQFAKRQITWMRGMENLKVFDCISDDKDHLIIEHVSLLLG